MRPKHIGRAIAAVCLAVVAIMSACSRKRAIAGADPNTFRVLNADFECSADQTHAYYRQAVISGADPRSFPPGRAVIGCTDTSISFAQ